MNRLGELSDRSAGVEAELARLRVELSELRSLTDAGLATEAKLRAALWNEEVLLGPGLRPVMQRPPPRPRPQSG